MFLAFSSSSRTMSRTDNALSICSFSMTIGGRNRITFLPASRKSTPFSMDFSRMLKTSNLNSIPSISPSPRTSFIILCFF